jgi:crotonobetainyl-CoA:carnitine CoA-transferase CaiB-like acyl-CoA transferase
MFARLCGALDVHELTRDPRFATNPARVENRAELKSLLEQRLRTEPNEVWLERLAAARVPAGPVNDVAHVAGSEQTRALGLLQSVGDLQLVAPPLSFDGERLMHSTAPPDLGAGAEELLSELRDGPPRPESV